MYFLFVYPSSRKEEELNLARDEYHKYNNKCNKWILLLLHVSNPGKLSIILFFFLFRSPDFFSLVVAKVVLLQKSGNDFSLLLLLLLV